MQLPRHPWLAGLALLVAACATVEPSPAAPGAVAAAGPACAAGAAAAEPAAGGPFAGWVALVVAADDRASGGLAATQAFDNARHDVAAGLVALGFAPERVHEASLACGGRASLGALDPPELFAPWLLARWPDRPAGCWVHLTSHGSEEGIVWGRANLRPAVLDAVLDDLCGPQPTIVTVSACHSGIFTGPEMAQPNRWILTAARADRTSFGCGVDSVRPAFDDCLIQALPLAATLADLADRTRACVAALERSLDLRPSEPQLRVGAAIADLARTLPLRAAGRPPS